METEIPLGMMDKWSCQIDSKEDFYGHVIVIQAMQKMCQIMIRFYLFAA